MQDSSGDEHAHCMGKKEMRAVCVPGVFFGLCSLWFFYASLTQSSRAQFCVSFEVTPLKPTHGRAPPTPHTPHPLTTSSLLAASRAYSSHLVQYISDVLMETCVHAVCFFCLPAADVNQEGLLSATPQLEGERVCLCKGLIVHRRARSCRSMRSPVVTPDSDLPSPC